MKSLIMSGLMALSLMMSACAHHRCHCNHGCKDGACKVEAGKADGKGGCEDCKGPKSQEAKPTTEPAKKP
ncbi:MAG: hypothetical protein L6Q37_05235 [Bdellovibrionaceae bacterium]|nr:hypothetical protein [Pseudobdellovibrionaceae bacterium]NUM58692.1 hypothetical protein [Pseudobdellovibrionaceae bacterium]